VGSIWFDGFSNECNQSMKHIWSVLLHNRWNVFVGSEEYVTWEIAPGLLADNTIVDVWSSYYSSDSVESVSWSMPTTSSGRSASSTSTSRLGRWRSFPYLADMQTEEDSDALWSYLCYEWNTLRHPNNSTNPKELIRFKFYMLQADVLPDMAFSPTRKRLTQSYHCKDKNLSKQEKLPQQQQCSSSA